MDSSKRILVGIVFLFAAATLVFAGAPEEGDSNQETLVIEAYEYPINAAVREGKLQHLEVIDDHTNQSAGPGRGISNLARFPYGNNKLLIVATLNKGKLKENITGLRWSFIKDSHFRYGGKYGTEINIIEAAGVSEGEISSNDNQIVTTFGDGPVYPPLPQSVHGLRNGSAEPMDEIKIGENQTWVLIRASEPGVTRVLVSAVTGRNVVSPEREFAVNWIRPYRDLCQKQKLQVNVIEAEGTDDPYVFDNSLDQGLNYKITVTDVSDYYQNPEAVDPLLYPEIPYKLRFRIDPLQQSSPAWPDAYDVGWGMANGDAVINHMEERLTAELRGRSYGDRDIDRKEELLPTDNGAAPGAEEDFEAFVIFQPYDPDPYFTYYLAKERSVEAAVAYSGSSCKDNDYSIPGYYSDINDESITLEYQPGETIGGLQVTWNPADAPDGADEPVHLVNTGGRIYQIYGQDGSGGGKWYILTNLDAGDDVWIDADRGDWIYYHTISNNNTGNGREPVIAHQKKVRVQ